MSCTRKIKNTAAAGTATNVSTVFAVPETAGEAAAAAEVSAVSAARTDGVTEAVQADAADTASSWTEVPMRRYVHPIPSSCGIWDCQSCPCQSCACQSAEETAYLARLLRQQRALLSEIRDLLMQMLPYCQTR